ncbi:putative transcription factor TIFY family [Helianthus annuus]|nr:putative transcription factor TIFY family [Helianthus annuus]
MAAASLLNIIIMAQNNNTNNNASDDVKPTILHDFLGRGCAAPAARFAAVSGGSGSSPSASASGGGGRGGGPVSTTSDLGSERQAGTLFEGVPFFGHKTDLAGSKIRYSGGKRSHSDSGFLPPAREVIPQLRPDFPETSHLMKMLRNVGTERPRWPHEEEPFMGMHQMRPTTSSSSWERAIPVNVGPVLQYPPRAAAGQVVPYTYQPTTSNRFKDANVGPPLISQSAADEGSRTGIKGSGILSSVAEPSKLKSLIGNTEAGSSTPHPHQGSASVSRQMTIFYGGQAHVFDDVHPNKADVIMNLAGSNGGSWSTSFLPKPSGGETISLNGGQGSVSIKDARGSSAEDKSGEKQ